MAPARWNAWDDSAEYGVQTADGRGPFDNRCIIKRTNTESEVKLMETTDIWFAAYIFKIVPKQVRGSYTRSGKKVFKFELEQAEWDDHKIGFINSEESEIKYRIEKLKDLAFQ